MCSSRNNIPWIYGRPTKETAVMVHGSSFLLLHVFPHLFLLMLPYISTNYCFFYLYSYASNDQQQHHEDAQLFAAATAETMETNESADISKCQLSFFHGFCSLDISQQKLESPASLCSWIIWSKLKIEGASTRKTNVLNESKQTFGQYQAKLWPFITAEKIWVS